MKITQTIDIASFFLKNTKRFSLLILMLFLAAGAFASLSLKGLKTEYNMKQFLPPHHPLLEADDAHKAKFHLADIEPFFALITLPEGEGTWLQAERANKLKEATEHLKGLEGVEYTLSLATVEGASSSKEGLTVGRLLDLTPSENWSARVLQDPILSPQLISQDAKTVLVAVGLQSISQERTAFLQNETRAHLENKFPTSQVRLGGIPAVQTEISKTLGQELKNFLLLALLGSLLTLLIFFRSVSSVLIPLFLMGLSTLLSLAAMAWAGVTFTVLTSTLPVLIAVTVVSMAAHTMMRYSADWELAKRSQDNPNPLRVLYRSYHGLLLPNFLTAITTGIGFFAIGFAKVPLVRQYGITVGFSIFICWIVVMSVLLPLLALFPVPKVRHWTEKRATWSIWVMSYPKVIVGVFGSICALCFFFGKDLNWSARLFDDLPAGHEARATTEFVDHTMGGMIPFDLILSGKEENAWNDPAALAKLDTLSKKWRLETGVGSVVGPQDLLRAAGRAQGRDLATTRQEAAEYSFLYSFSEENPYKKFVTSDGRSARISLRLNDLPANDLEALVQKITTEAKTALPGWEIAPTGMATTVHAMNKELSHELIFGFWQALAMIGFILCLVFRSLKWAVAAIVPNLAPVAFLMGALYVTGTPIKPGIALIFSIAVGISFDNTVYLLGRLKLLMRRAQDGKVPVLKAWYQEGNLCFFSSMAISSGFLVFLASYFSMNQQFGLYMLLALTGGLISDLLFLPALLAAFPWMVNHKPKKMKKEKFMLVKAASITLALSASLAYAGPQDAKAILQKVEKNVNSRDEVASIKMTIAESDGTSKGRSLEIKRKGQEKSQKVLVKLEGPADLKGTALLSVDKDQWLYLPSQKQTRRIQSGNKKSSFMDSELSYEDLSAGADAKYESKYLKEAEEGGRKYAVIENSPKGESSYGKVIVWVDTQNYLVGKMEYFDKSMKPLKVSTFSGYKQFDQGIWRAQKIEVKNLQTKRGTTLELSDLKVNKGIDDSEFTESALSDTD